MFSFRWRLLVAACVAGSATEALAQAVQTLDTLVVTANKREQELEKIDGAVSVQTAEQLRQANITNVSDLERVFPGLVIRQRGNRAYSNFTVRGMSSPDFYNPSVQVYVDGVPQGDSFLTQELLDVDRVEFLRGPQGTLYGRNAFGGVLNIVTRRARENRVAGAITGTNRTIGGELAATGVLATDMWFTDIAVRGLHDSGQITDLTTGRKVDTSEVWSGRAQLRYAPAGGPFDATLSVAKERLDSREEVYVLDTQLDQRIYPVGVPYPDLQRDTLSSAFSWNYVAGPFKISGVSSYQDIDLQRRLFGFSTPEATRLWSQELKAVYDNAGPLTALFGIYYQDTDFTRWTPAANARNDVNARAAAAFTELSYQLTDRLTLTGGARLSYDASEISFRGPFAFTNSVDFTSLQPKLSLGYQITEAVRLYGLVSRGYKAGGFNHAVSTPLDANPYRPEKALNFEIGARSAFLGGRLLLSGAVYHIKSEDKQIYVGVVPNLVIRNVGEATSTGIEIETALRPTELLTLNASVSYGVSRFEDYVDPVTGIDFSGNRVPYAPDLTLHAAFRQVIPQSVFSGTVALTGAVHVFSRTYFDEANSLGQPAYATLDAGLEAEFRQGWSLKIFGTNLTDEIYRTYSFRSGPAVFSNIGQGRIFGVTLRGAL
ncbi:TonB-dependent receptor domain-containing protein [Bradyrhizobium sp. LHD-71]|uniref:TonB-dependent receptor n=1 Tax=Bradyrhizobium sp. LHD-71 TaxID=3072141 RepID=UPI00280F5202|nr:TonB-dependent receptor [Bradyrhizobium sp. LHD-71]MDQ8728671.1 TonB-dependent receptor [Bradyrhizobium sp. LHD-71]